jgi:hypothetical protein
LAAFTTVHNNPDWLKAQYMIWTSSIGYDVFYPNGAIVGELVDSWIHGTVEFPEGWDGILPNSSLFYLKFTINSFYLCRDLL